MLVVGFCVYNYVGLNYNSIINCRGFLLNLDCFSPGVFMSERQRVSDACRRFLCVYVGLNYNSGVSTESQLVFPRCIYV